MRKLQREVKEKLLIIYNNDILRNTVSNINKMTKHLINVNIGESSVVNLSNLQRGGRCRWWPMSLVDGGVKPEV